MTGHEPIDPLLLVALAVLAATLIAKLARRLHVPAAVGYMLFGIGLRVADGQLGLVSTESTALLGLLGELGVAALLFRVGLESNLTKLLEQLPRALLVWLSNVGLSASLGFAVALACGLGLITSAFVAVALSATSIGLSVAVWEERGCLDTKLGALLLDVAELDDLSAVVATSILVVAAPAIHEGGLELGVVATSVGGLVLGLVVFGLACFLFSRYLEERLTRAFVHDKGEGGVLYLVGTGLALAGVAGYLGLSVAIGALFAGLMFSRDPEAVRVEHSFTPIHALFTPFFFLDIGFAVDVGLLAGALGLGAVLLVPAVVGKLAGGGLPMIRRDGWRAGAIMGVSMVPRAEIALVVARLGNRLGEWAVPDQVYAAIVLLCTITAMVGPLVLDRMLGAWPVRD